jgi:D-serine deaminase-like pyridoxal phosphate-dependent protein
MEQASEYSWFPVENEAEITSPALLIYPERIRSNISGMIKIAGDATRLRPHVKTHKMPAIVRLQMEAGISKFKCATVSEAEMVAGCGAEDIILCVQPVGPNIARFFHLKEEFPATRFSCITDSGTVIARLSDMAVNKGLETNLWLDINNGMNRSGIAPGKKAAGLAQQINSMPMLKLEGLHVYDGHIRESDISQRQTLCDQAFAPVMNFINELKRAGIHNLKIVAGGTTTFPVHALRQDVDCSPGTPVLWDYGYSSLFPDMDFLHAAVLFTRIISKPAANMICLDLGTKAVASEMPHPRVIIAGLSDYKIINHSEEHMVIETSRADSMEPGDVLYGIPWHICPTVDRFDAVSVVNDCKVTEQWAVTARKRKITI